ncbi:hypothetical protein HOLDEFILI_00517 [Holdemania filiformis DSM 12042]|uniref:Uncharacterized protein n=1 Tax=Holdemania filiformis DSM 12042 TaxID=545696 RepID=B9Y3Y6_9FIRM|nr:hypothetical protein HOLDEFILI_00517 [Holdemania filiformis DSM 12042]
MKSSLFPRFIRLAWTVARNRKRIVNFKISNQLSELLKELGECFYLCLISIIIILA